MNLAKFPRRCYTDYPTPIVCLSNLTEILSGPNIFMKRDDLLGLAVGSSKTRKLEFLIADAIEKGADTIITCGDVQSNHCCLTLAATCKENLKCHLLLEERVPDSYDEMANGNNFLFKLMAAEELHVLKGKQNLIEEMQKLADKLTAMGRKPYIIPGGGSNKIGDLGYLACAEEINYQSLNSGTHYNYIVCTSGSGGTHAGLLVGMKATNTDTAIVGICVNRDKASQEVVLLALAQKIANNIHANITLSEKDIIAFDEYNGRGYSLPTQEMVETVKLVASREGILLDPTYTGKAMTGLIDLVKKGYFKKGENVLFLHTGGLAGLYAHNNYFFA